MNTEFRELTAASAALTAQGNTQAIATTQIRAALVALSKETGAKNMFEMLAGMTYAEFQQQGGTLQEAMTMIVEEADRTGKSLPQLFGRIEGAVAALALASTSGAQTFSQAMADTTGAAEEAAQRMEDTTSHRVAVIKSQWEGFKTTMGEVFTDVTLGFTGYVHDIGQLWGSKTIAEKEAMKVSEENWRKYAKNVGRTQAAHAQWARETLTSLPGMTGTGQVSGIPGSALFTQAGPETPGEWIYGVSGMGAGGADVWGYADMMERWRKIQQENERDQYKVFSGGGGAGGKLDRIAEEVKGLRDDLRTGQAIQVQLDANVDEGVIVRADTQERITTQAAAGIGYRITDRGRQRMRDLLLSNALYGVPKIELIDFDGDLVEDVSDRFIVEGSYIRRDSTRRIDGTARFNFADVEGFDFGRNLLRVSLTLTDRAGRAGQGCGGWVTG